MNDESHCIRSYWWNWLSSCRQALEEGHEVTVIVRNSEAVNIRNERLKVFQGEVLEPALFSKRIVAQDAVISTLGVNHRKATTVYSKGIENITKAMQDAGIHRLICLSSVGLVIHNDTPWMVRHPIKHVIQPILNTHIRTRP